MFVKNRLMNHERTIIHVFRHDKYVRSKLQFNEVEQIVQNNEHSNRKDIGNLLPLKFGNICSQTGRQDLKKQVSV